MSESVKVLMEARAEAKQRFRETTVQLEDLIYDLKASGSSWNQIQAATGIERSSVRFHHRNAEKRRGGLSEARSAV